MHNILGVNIPSFIFSSAFVANLDNHIEIYGERIVESVRFKYAILLIP